MEVGGRGRGPTVPGSVDTDGCRDDDPGLEGGWEQHRYIAEGRCEGAISGRFRGTNFPERRTASGPFRPDFRAVIETHDAATILVEWHG